LAKRSNAAKTAGAEPIDWNNNNTVDIEIIRKFAMPSPSVTL
jgi:hypothetical protein